MIAATKRTYFFLGINLALLLLACLYKLLEDKFFDFSFKPPVESVGSLALLLNLFLIGLILLDLKLSIRKKDLGIARIVEPKLSINRNHCVTIDIKNFSKRNLTGIVLDDSPLEFWKDRQYTYINVPGNTKTTLYYNVKAFYRGKYEFKNVNIKYLSRFKLVWKIIKVATHSQTEVYPDMIGLKNLSVKLSKSFNAGEIKIKKKGEGYEFASLKEYTAGDDIKRIDWRATARRDHPIVRTYESEKDQNVIILLDAGRMMATDLSGITRFDWGLNASLSLAMTALWRGDKVGFGIFIDKPTLYIPPKGGKNQLKTIIDSVYNVQPKFVEPDYLGVLINIASIQKKRALFVLITDLIDTIASQVLLEGLSHLCPRHLPFCVTLADKTISNMAQEKVTNIGDVYKKSIAIELLNSRQQALKTLVTRGGMFLDVPPEELNDALIERYIAIKQRGKI